MDCLIKAFSIVLEIPYDKLIEEIGHDGSEIIWPDLNPPQCFRGFHIQEIICVGYKYGYAIVGFDKQPSSIPMEGATPYLLPQIEIQEIMEQSNGVLTGLWKSRNLRHAIAWNNKTSISDLEIEHYYAVFKIKSN